MNRMLLIVLAPLVTAAPAMAQTMDHSKMPGMKMPMPAAKAPAKRAARPAAKAPPNARAPARAPEKPQPRPQPALPAAAQADPHAGHDMAAAPGEAPAAADAPEPAIPKAPPPPPPQDHAADRYFDPSAMARSRAVLSQEHGGSAVSKVMADIAEYQAGTGGGGYRWGGQAWVGGDINRFVVKSEGEGSRRGGLEGAEVQALYSRAIGPYFDLQAGVRQDFKPRSRTYAAVGVEGLAPFWLDVEGALFLSTKGEILGRVEGSYDLRLTQRLILQPRAEINLAAQDTPQMGTGSGVTDAELGLRLRYEVRREAAPYIGVSYDRKFGGTADYARAHGEDTEATTFVIGIRAWF